MPVEVIKDAVDAKDELNTLIDDVKLLSMTLLLLNKKLDPVIKTLPVNAWVFERLLPNILDPDEYSTLEVIVWTTNFCAVIVPATVKLSAYDAVTAFVANDDVPCNDPVKPRVAIILPVTLILPLNTLKLPDKIFILFLAVKSDKYEGWLNQAISFDVSYPPIANDIGPAVAGVPFPSDAILIPPKPYSAIKVPSAIIPLFELPLYIWK